MYAKQNIPTLLGIAVVALAVGCIPSLYPIYTAQDVVLRNEILGRWTNEKSPQTWEFSQQDGDAYELRFVDKEGRVAKFAVHLTEIQDNLFMDLYPLRSSETDPDFYRLHLVSTHTFFRLALSDDKLSLSFLNPQWLKQHHHQHPDVSYHARDDNSVVLTADTKTLRDFVAKLHHTQGAFTTPFELTKVSKE